MAARRPESEEPYRAMDCVRLASYNGRDEVFVSTPNMEFVPQLPEQNPSTPITYFADGMLGLYEHFKWPQKFYHELPHAMAAPANPDLLYWQSNDFFLRDEQDFFVQDTQKVLPSFKDSRLPWFHITEKHFKVSDDIPNAQVGRLNLDVLVRLKDGFQEVVATWTTLAKALTSAAVDRGGSAPLRIEELINFAQSKAKRLGYTCGVLAGGNLSSFHTLMWFREYQRLLLELRAIIIYMGVIQPRLDNPSANHSQHPLPLRGVITSKEFVVQELYRVGVPVWFVRSKESLTTDTRILRVCNKVPAGVSFSSRRGMRHGKHERAAPLWSHAPNDDPTAGNVLSRLKRFQITNHALVGPVKAYNFDQAIDIEWERRAEREPEIAGPDVDIQAMRSLDIDDDVQEWPAHHEEVDTGGNVWDGNDELSLNTAADMVQSGSGSAWPAATISSGSSSPAVSVAVQSTTFGANEMSTDAPGGISVPVEVQSKKLKTGKTKQPAAPANRPENLPSWVPPEAPGWAAAVNISGLGDEVELPKTFHLPPPYLFYNANEEATGVAVRFHNWIRIRSWCIQQVINTAAHGMVLMSGAEWWIALEGAYYQVHHEVADEEDAQRAAR